MTNSKILNKPSDLAPDIDNQIQNYQDRINLLSKLRISKLNSHSEIEDSTNENLNLTEKGKEKIFRHIYNSDGIELSKRLISERDIVFNINYKN